ncbi:MAG: AsmA-like C-terminal domain-containing protein [Kiloniellales bacterium]|nr:AsmA-like C-terminal domain-containing protein [Kiloniellales bacterium]
MIKRSLRICLQTLAGLAVLGAVLVGAGSWRLAQGPVKLDFLTPYLESAVRLGTEEKSRLKIGETVLIWADWSRAMDVRLRDVKLVDEAGLPLISLPELSVNISLAALMVGQIAPSRIEAFGASVTLVRQEDGGFDFESYGLPEEETADEAAQLDISQFVPEFIAQMNADPQRTDPLSFLRAVRIVDGSLFIIDRSINSVWHAPSAHISVQRLSSGLAARVTLSFSDVQETGELDLSLFYQAENESIDLEARLVDLRAPSLGFFSADMAPVAGFDLPLSGSLEASLAANGRLRSMSYKITAAPGSLTLPQWLPEPVAVHALSLQGAWEPEAGALEMEEVAATVSPHGFEGDIDAAASLSFSASARFLDEGLRLEFGGEVRRVSAGDIGLFWPLPVAKNARDWTVENISEGEVETADITAGLWIPTDDLEATTVEHLSGTLRYRDLTVYYQKPLPPVVDISGTATFDVEQMVFIPETGRLDGIEVESGKVAVLGLDKEDQELELRIKIGGPLRDALTLLNDDSLGLMSELGVDPARTAGDAKAEVHFSFPLIQDLTFEEIRVGAEAEIKRLRLDSIALDQDVTEGDVRLTVDNESMTVSGPIVFGGVPILMDWTENFGREAPFQSVFKVEFDSIDEKDLDAFGLDLLRYLEGELAGSVEIKLDAQRNGRIDMQADLLTARLIIDDLKWLKPRNVPGRLEGSLGVSGERFVDFELRRLEAGTLAARGRGEFDETGTSLRRVMLEDVRLGRNRLSSIDLEWQPGGMRVVLGEGELDAEPFMTTVTKRPAANGAADQASDEMLELPNLFASAPHLSSVRFGEGRRVEDVSFLMDRRDGGWQRLVISGRVPEDAWTVGMDVDPDRDMSMQRAGNTKLDQDDLANRQENAVALEEAEAEIEEMGLNEEERSFTFDYGPADNGRFDLTVHADDVGGLLYSFNLNDTVEGGRLSISAASDGPIPQNDLAGKIRVRNFKLVETPLLANLLSVASFTGLLDTLTGNGIRFERMKGDFVLVDGTAKTELLRVYGPGLGITARGDIDLDDAAVDLEGTIVPAYSVNQLLEKIPLVGVLLTGGEGEGLFAVLYSAEGPMNDPEVSVNPLSLLTPGFLRGIFGRSGGDPPTVFPPGPQR